MTHDKIRDIQFLYLLYHTFTQRLVLTILILISYDPLSHSIVKEGSIS